MELNGALNETVGIMDGLVAGLTSEHREMKTPCKQFTVHDLMNHVVNTSKFVSAVVAGTPENMPAEGTDHLTEGPVNGWNDGKGDQRGPRAGSGPVVGQQQAAKKSAKKAARVRKSA
jgi:hypothetical protein